MLAGDTYKFQGLRRMMVEDLQKKGIRDESVLQAMQKIPRHIFMDSALGEFAYKDQAFPIGSEQTISNPYTVAFQSELLDVQEGMHVLEIGTGSGYQAWVLALMGAKVVSIERVRTLYLQVQELIRTYALNTIESKYGDGFLGHPEGGPYDRIIVTCGAPEIPHALLGQLKIGGKMVIPVGENAVQELVRLTRKSETEFIKKGFGEFKFVPMLKKLRP